MLSATFTNKTVTLGMLDWRRSVKGAVQDFRTKIFDPLHSEVQEKLEKTEKMYSFCVDMLADAILSLPVESNGKTAYVTPPRRR